MQFKIRDGFVVHLEKLVKTGEALERRVTSYFEGETVDLTADEANEHLHKLEGVDKAGKAHVEAAVVQIPPPQAAVIDQTALAAAIAATLVSLGVVKPGQQAQVPA